METNHGNEPTGTDYDYELLDAEYAATEMVDIERFNSGDVSLHIDALQLAGTAFTDLADTSPAVREHRDYLLSALDDLEAMLSQFEAVTGQMEQLAPGVGAIAVAAIPAPPLALLAFAHVALADRIAPAVGDKPAPYHARAERHAVMALELELLIVEQAPMTAHLVERHGIERVCELVQRVRTEA